MIPGLGGSPGEWLPTPVFWPEEIHGLYSPWGHKELDTTERLSKTVNAFPNMTFTLGAAYLVHSIFGFKRICIGGGRIPQWGVNS